MIINYRVPLIKNINKYNQLFKNLNLMSQDDKIKYFNSKIGLNDDDLAKQFLFLTDGNAEQAVELYLSEMQISQNNYNNINLNNENNSLKIEFSINYQMFLNLTVFTRNSENTYNGLITFLYEKFIYVSPNVNNFLTLLKNHAGLAIILPSEKNFDVRNDMIRAHLDQFCQDIIRNVVILPVMSDSKVGKELSQKCSSSNYPLYLFCKYKNDHTFEINYKIEGHFNIANSINFFLNCFPESDKKPEILRSINNSMVNLRNSVMSQNSNSNNNNDANNNNANNNNVDDNNMRNNSYPKSLLANSLNYFSGNIDELNEIIAKLEGNNYQENNNINNSLNNSQNNNNNSLNNINYNQSQNDINNYNNNQDYNNSYNPSQIDYNNNQSYNQHSINNISNNPSINNHSNNNSQIQNSLIQNNQSIKDSIYGLAPGEIMAKREREMKELERQHEEKIRKEEEEKQKKLKAENEIKLRNEKYEKEALLCRQNLPQEPDENDPDICKIMFKYPTGEKSVERRFLKNDKVIILYNYIKSLGREIFFESNSNNFDLFGGFPTKSLENSKDKTIEEEGLSNSIIYIREK